MTLCDAGPLVALVSGNDPHHTRCVAALDTLPAGGLITTWACFAEAMYLLARGGWLAQDGLWRYLADRPLRLHVSSDAEWQRMRVSMHRYRDTPMDLADASIVAASETLHQ